MIEISDKIYAMLVAKKQKELGGMKIELLQMERSPRTGSSRQEEEEWETIKELRCIMYT